MRLTADGAEVVPLGRTPIEVNGAASSKAVVLANGDEIQLPGLVIKVVLETVVVREAAPRSCCSASWAAVSVLRRRRSSSVAELRQM